MFILVIVIGKRKEGRKEGIIGCVEKMDTDFRNEAGILWGRRNSISLSG